MTNSISRVTDGWRGRLYWGDRREGEEGEGIKTLCISGEYFNQTNTSAQQYKGPRYKHVIIMFSEYLFYNLHILTDNTGLDTFLQLSRTEERN